MPNKNLLVAILAVGVSAAATAGMSSSSSAAKNSNSSVTSSAGSKAANGAGANGGSNNFNMTGSASVYMGNYSADLSDGTTSGLRKGNTINVNHWNVQGSANGAHGFGGVVSFGQYGTNFNNIFNKATLNGAIENDVSLFEAYATMQRGALSAKVGKQYLADVNFSQSPSFKEVMSSKPQLAASFAYATPQNISLGATVLKQTKIEQD